MESGLLLSGLFNGSIRVWDKWSWWWCLFASGSWDRLVKIWNVSSGQCVRCLDEHSYNILDLVFVEHSNKLISCSGDLSVRVWDLNTFTTSEIVPIGLVTSFTNINKDMNTIVCASYYDKCVRVWDLSRSECLSMITTDFEILKLEFISII